MVDVSLFAFPVEFKEFKDMELIGRGSFAEVYKATFRYNEKPTIATTRFSERCIHSDLPCVIVGEKWWR
tara:strand:- start:737 stop:943 length:207 start_codon:yes stop_codon:yes gene_type:complete